MDEQMEPAPEEGVAPVRAESPGRARGRVAPRARAGVTLWQLISVVAGAVVIVLAGGWKIFDWVMAREEKSDTNAATLVQKATDAQVKTLETTLDAKYDKYFKNFAFCAACVSDLQRADLLNRAAGKVNAARSKLETAQAMKARRVVPLEAGQVSVWSWETRNSSSQNSDFLVGNRGQNDPKVQPDKAAAARSVRAILASYTVAAKEVAKARGEVTTMKTIAETEKYAAVRTEILDSLDGLLSEIDDLESQSNEDQVMLQGVLAQLD